MFYHHIFPSLFPFFIISHLLTSYGAFYFIQEVFKPIFNLLHINNDISFIFLMSLLSGSPHFAIYTKKLYLDKKINKKDATLALLFTYFPNPLFLFMISSSFFKNSNLGILFFLSTLFSNTLLLFLFSNKNKEEKVNFKKALNDMVKYSKEKKFSNVLITSIKESFTSCFFILGTIIFTYIVTSFFTHFISNIYIQSFIRASFEITQGLKSISSLPTTFLYKILLSSFFISFGGFSIYMQIISIISDTDLNTSYYLLARILQGIISSIFTLFILLCKDLLLFLFL